MNWWDTNKDGYLDGFEMDRFQLDHAEYPGMFEHESDRYDDSGYDMTSSSYGTSDDEYDYDDDDDDPWSSYDRDYDDDDEGYGYDDDDEDYGYDDDDDEDDDDERRGARGKGAARSKTGCYDCLYWCDNYDLWTREVGCRIFVSYVSEKCPDISGYPRPEQDGKTCKEFRPRLKGRTLGCLECKHFKLFFLEHQRATVAADFPTYCDIKDQVEDIASITAYEDDEIRLWFTVICPRFELEESRLSNEPEPTWLARTVRSRKASGRF